ncbi:MAG: hypothetical protein AB1714_13615 [Acidobacteriota bacterium]
MVRKTVSLVLVAVFAAWPAFAADQGRGNIRKDKKEIMKLASKSDFFTSYLTGDRRNAGSGCPAVADSSVAQAATSNGGAILPERWWRKLAGEPVRNWSITVIGDTATASVVTDADATLYVDTTHDGVKNPGTKPIEDRITRYSTWVKTDGKWKLSEISAAQVNLREMARQTVFITEVKVSVNGQLVRDVTDPTEKMSVDTEILRVHNGDVVTVESAVSNSSQSGLDPLTYVYCHPNRPSGRRDLMFDDGVNGGDKVAADGIWTYEYTVNLNPGVHFAAVDALDSLCLQNETDDDYNSNAWGMPYVVE